MLYGVQVWDHRGRNVDALKLLEERGKDAGVP